jgi:hypothetical protein
LAFVCLSLLGDHSHLLSLCCLLSMGSPGPDSALPVSALLYAPGH